MGCPFAPTGGTCGSSVDRPASWTPSRFPPQGRRSSGTGSVTDERALSSILLAETVQQEYARCHSNYSIFPREWPAGPCSGRHRAFGHTLTLSGQDERNDHYPHKTVIQKHLKDRLGSLFDLEYDLLLDDVTSTCLEGECAANLLAKRGYGRKGSGEERLLTISGNRSYWVGRSNAPLPSQVQYVENCPKIAGVQVGPAPARFFNPAVGNPSDGGTGVVGAGVAVDGVGSDCRRAWEEDDVHDSHA